ncbi:hypothetical protein L484_003447 [Morus notabilis]|uniref:Uncharacterized protein n=1 Tax=Morus notabilis TaxID=981085 RepID=W9R4F4_9ROSA|nr:hypothetical protein L484_003447 [Morus notabilis]
MSAPRCHNATFRALRRHFEELPVCVRNHNGAMEPLCWRCGVAQTSRALQHPFFQKFSHENSGYHTSSTSRLQMIKYSIEN